MTAECCRGHLRDDVHLDRARGGWQYAQAIDARSGRTHGFAGSGL
jgi:hypothetical protein